ARAIPPHIVARPAALKLVDVLARRHAAIANQNDPLEPEALLQITHDIRHGLGVAPIALEYVMSNRPAIDHDQSDQYLHVARLASRLYPLAPNSGGPLPSK